MHSRNDVIGMALLVTVGANTSSFARKRCRGDPQSDMEWSNSAQSKDVDTWVAPYSADAI